MRAGTSIRHGRDFKRVLTQGNRARRDGLLVAALAGSDGPSRLGLTVPGSVGSAVVRNRVRRRLREAFRAAGPMPGFDVVVRADGSAARRGYQELAADLTHALGRVGVVSR